ncbi:MAG: 5-(carboxyamino)imidazole ribonucleotide synthase [Congregibacter sp.]
MGIIGDGQLGMMLCQAAPAIGLRTVMLCSDSQGAGAQSADECVVGAMDDEQALKALISACDIITYEREDIPEAAIAMLRAAEATGEVQCFPPLSAIEIIQDKAKQKRWMAASDLATLAFRIAETPEDIESAARELGYPLVQKALRGGFDGRGVQLLRSADEIPRAWPGETLCEQFAGDFREIAVLVVRDRQGTKTHFGPVDMTFETDYSVLDTVTAPAQISNNTTDDAVSLAYRAIDALDGVGVFGVEMFLLASGEVLINEISPRVHNAGHYTMEACSSSQFEQHLRAVAGMPLAATELNTAACMKNLLCTPSLKQADVHCAAEVINRDNGVFEHWYGKSPARLMRKLGHITALADSPETAAKAADQRWQTIQQEASSI